MCVHIHACANSLRLNVRRGGLLHRIGHFLELTNSVVGDHRNGQFHLIDQFDVELVISMTISKISRKCLLF
jgi:hypothetical protein